jgi:hypothetical protein
MTKATSAWGWLAAGVLALGVNGFLHDEGANFARRVADRVVSRAEPVVALASGRAEEFLANARLATAREQVQSCRFGARVVRIQSSVVPMGLARLDAMSAREEAQLARLEANRARMEAQAARFQFAAADFSAPRIPVICPRVRVNVPRMVVRIPAPVVHVSDDGAGPI